MAFNQNIADQIQSLIAKDSRYSSKKMFGGIAFMDRGNMCIGVLGDKLVARVGKENYESLLKEPHASPMTFTGRSMKGMIYVDTTRTKDLQKLIQKWLDHSLDFTPTLPSK